MRFVHVITAPDRRLIAEFVKGDTPDDFSIVQLTQSFPANPAPVDVAAALRQLADQIAALV